MGRATTESGFFYFLFRGWNDFGGKRWTDGWISDGLAPSHETGAVAKRKGVFRLLLHFLVRGGWAICCRKRMQSLFVYLPRQGLQGGKNLRHRDRRKTEKGLDMEDPLSPCMRHQSLSGLWTTAFVERTALSSKIRFIHNNNGSVLSLSPCLCTRPHDSPQDLDNKLK